MNKELIEKLLREQTTPEEEHLFAQSFRQHKDADHWLIEDETAEYDRIVGRRCSRHRMVHFALAESGGQMAENGGRKPSETAFSKKIIP